MEYNNLIKIIDDYNKNNIAILNSDDETKFFYNLLLQNDIVTISRDGNLKKKNNYTVGLAKLQVKGRFGFVVSVNYFDHYVHNVGDYLHDDEVIVIEHDAKRGKTKEAIILGLVKRSKKQVLAFVSKTKKVSLVNSHELRMYDVNNVNMEITEQYTNCYIFLNVKKVKNFKITGTIGNFIASKDEPDLQMKLVLNEFDIEADFSETILKQANEIASEKVELTNSRRDLRDLLFMTIDGADAKDLDDAVCLIKEQNNFRVYVSIADVSHYIKEESELDKQARSRSTSVYFVDRVVPMLPKTISNGICSLHPNVDRYTLTCEMLINSEGDVIESTIYPSIINSKYQMTYFDVNEMIINNNGHTIAKYSQIYGVLCEMNKLAKRINQKRLKRGSFNLEDKEPKFTVDENGDITNIEVRIRYDAERLIEEFMIIANETVAQTIYNLDLPFIYRVHGQPSPDRLVELAKAFKLFDIDLIGNFTEFHSTSFKIALDSVKTPLDKRILSDLIVRSLQKAVYSPNNSGHFGLASSEYTHFTSPIRRYPDLIVHRLLRKYLFDSNYQNISYLQTSLNSIAQYASEKERKAIKAEQKIEDQKKAEYMRQFIGDSFSGKVASISKFGFFVELDNTIRGLVRYKQLKNFTKEENFVIKFKKEKALTIGSDIDVRLISVDKVRGTVDFEPIKYEVNREEKSEGNRKQQKSKTRLYNSKNTRSRNRTKGKRNKVDSRRKSKSKR